MERTTFHAPVLPSPEEEPTVPLWPTAGQALGIGRSTTYDLAAAGRFPVPVIRLGGKIRVPTAALRRLLHLDPSDTAGHEAA